MEFSKLLHKLPTRGANCGAVIVAAGNATRMKGTDKIMTELCGEPLIVHTLYAFQQSEEIQEIVLVTREELLEPLRELCVRKKITKLTRVCRGGETRAASVQAGLEQLSKQCNLVAIHDGARPLVSQSVIRDAVCKAAKYHAAAPAIPVKDTIKLAHGGIVESTPDRSSLYAVQTPQVFDLDLYRAALQKAVTEKLELTDDCSAAEHYGIKVVITEGSDENLKVTTPTDLILAEALMKRREQK
ncbi:MAG: 2-C-methyl-D-erythritol 4-phosphate cytidylyltransferase [Oscillospiraceae bacterium]|nr:2-C-methyl-D-erythritol 4-phosphate cytidylyltransferase [Oscillospiraceae bacterium]